MKKIGFLLVLAIAFISSCKEDPPQEIVNSNLSVSISHEYNGADLNFLTDSYIMPKGDTVNFSRLSYLLSNFYLVNSNDEKVKLEDQYAFISAAEDITTFELTGVPKGSYKAFGFHLGIDSLVNYGDPNIYPADHPLSPIRNSLHWSWTGGYIFNAIEGMLADGSENFIYHVTGGKETIEFEYTVFLNKENNALNASLTYDLAEAFKNPEELDFNIDGYSAHTEEAPAAVKIFKNLVNVITLNSIE
ncbi:MAG: hypothetical protein KJP21_06770 [Bacteroidia bacterium]|nr:hypothetical protein [Bacteroidia bacterium]NNJ56415.1 hypothetical protein [Bacteroidia bacterium]